MTNLSIKPNIEKSKSWKPSIFCLTSHDGGNSGGRERARNLLMQRTLGIEHERECQLEYNTRVSVHYQQLSEYRELMEYLTHNQSRKSSAEFGKPICQV